MNGFKSVSITVVPLVTLLSGQVVVFLPGYSGFIHMKRH